VPPRGNAGKIRRIGEHPAEDEVARSIRQRHRIGRCEAGADDDGSIHARGRGMDVCADDGRARRIARQLEVERSSGGRDRTCCITREIELDLHGAMPGRFGAADGGNLVGGAQKSREDHRRGRRRGRLVVIAGGEEHARGNREERNR